MHFLKRNRATASPIDLVFVDTETLPTEVQGHDGLTTIHKLRLGVAIGLRLEAGEVTRRKVLRFRPATEFWDWLDQRLRKRSNTWLVAHNAGFDMTTLGLWELLEKRDLRFASEREGSERPEDNEPFVCLDDPPTIIPIRDKSGYRFTILDTMNYWQVPLEQLGASVGLEKLPLPDFADDDEAWFARCLRDVEIIEAAMLGYIRWVKDQDLGRFRYTGPAQSFAAFRHRFMTTKILIHGLEDVQKLERASYYGGYHDCLYVGSVSDANRLGIASGTYSSVNGQRRPWPPLYRLDVRSLYPSVMREGYFPCRLLDHRLLDPGEAAPMEALGDWSVATVYISTMERAYPKRMNGGTFHVVGSYWTTLAAPELVPAIRAGHVAAVGSYATYRVAQLFGEFVDYFWGQRQHYELHGDQVGAGLCKLLLNALSGKFAQRGPEWAYEPDAYIPRPWHTWLGPDPNGPGSAQYRSLAWLAQRKIKDVENPEAFPGISAFITSYGRERMRALRAKCPAGSVVYQCTDSLIVTQDGLDALMAAGEVDGSALGKLRLESCASSATIRNLGDYTFGQEEVRSGRKRDGRSIRGDGWEQTCFAGLGTTLAQPLLGGVETWTQAFERRRQYGHGVVDSNGWTCPLVVQEPLAGESPSAACRAAFL